MQAFARRLRTLRQTKHLTQAQLAQQCGLHINQLARYETGRAQPMMQAIQRLSLALGCTADALLFDQQGESLPPDLSRLLQQVDSLPAAKREHVRVTVEALVNWYGQELLG